MTECKNCKKNFVITQEDIEFYKQFDVPKPKMCPECRMVRRFLERNPKTLYYRKCNLSGKQTLSQYHKDHLFPVYSPESWWGDAWDGLDYGMDFDFNRPFFEQFRELKNKVPHLALFNTQGTIENSDYNNCTAYLKNCYLIAESDYCEDCYYSNLLKKSNDIVDCSVCYDSELCYECTDCNGCKNLFYSRDCQNCHDGYFLDNCLGCENCIGCINLRHKKYMIFNKQYSKEEYEKLKEEMNLDTREGIEELQNMSGNFFVTQPHRFIAAEQNQNCYGDHLFNSKNAYYCFDSKDLEDCRYCAKLSLGVKNSMDYNSWGNKAELIYQCTSFGDNSYNCKFCANCQTNMNNCDYCAECFSCSDCFGCVGLKKQKYCIFNKKYSEGGYHKLREQIIEHMKKTGEWGEFFPLDTVAFGYNESMAIDVFPLTKDEALSKGYKWYEEEKTTSEAKGENIFMCSCGKNFKIIPQEANFYKKLNIPTPEKCPACRHKERVAKRRPLKLWSRTCNKCNTEIQTSYSPNRPEKVYCEKCYLEEVY